MKSPFFALAGMAIALCAALTGCSTSSADQPIPGEGEPRPAISRPTAPNPAAATLSPVAGPADFAFAGELTQGGWIRGIAPGGTVSATFDGAPLALAGDGTFFAAFDRDAGSEAVLAARLKDGRIVERRLSISPRAWNIERVNIARRGSGPTEAFLRIREPELARIAAARTIRSDSQGWRQDFIWPAKGRISGRFGSQRIYRGEPGSYHSGLDIATGESGTPFASPADGVVVLATEVPFSLEGYLLIIDHGMGLNSAFLHCASIAVKEGDRVTQGQYIGRIGATGRATGPHLHWGMMWHGARIDPILFTGPMQ